MTEPFSQPTWVQFLASPDEAGLQALTLGQGGRLSHYQIQDIIPVRGSTPVDLGADWTMLRLETAMPITRFEEGWAPSTSSIIPFQGVTTHLQYTSHSQRQELDRRSAGELEPSEQTIAVLIPIGKTAAWWALAQDQRQAQFQSTRTEKGHTVIGLAYADRVFRKLYHSRYLKAGLSYDFLTYFEFQERDTEAFKALLTELRDPRDNPEWAYVDFEFEIWMTKRG